MASGGIESDSDDEAERSHTSGHDGSSFSGVFATEEFQCQPKKKTVCVSEGRNPETGVWSTKTRYRDRRQRTATRTNATKRTKQWHSSLLQDQYNLDVNQGFELPHFTLEDMIEDVSQHLEEDIPGPAKSAWTSRMEAVDENWKAIRPLIFQAVLECEAVPDNQGCDLCGDEEEQVTLRCTECLHQYLCTKCDRKVHRYQPFHRREMWLHGYIESIPSCRTVAWDGKVFFLENFDQYFPVKFPSRCRFCKGENFDIEEPRNASQYIVVTLQGRLDLKKQQVRCTRCMRVDANTEVGNIIANGFFPGNPKIISTIIEVKLLEWIDAIVGNMPGTSLSAFAKVLEDISIEDTTVNRTVLMRCLAEFRYCKREHSLCQGKDAMKCPPCSIHQHSAHVDGNFKVYRYAKVPRGTQTSYFSGTFIDQDSEVSGHMDKVYSYRNNKKKKKGNRQSSMCGKTTWKAAREESLPRAKLDEAGLDVAGCRHSLAQKAVNMFTGEKYGYAHYIQVNFLLPKEVKFMWLDVICQYWPWARQEELIRLDPKYREAITNMKPALSVMHAKAHSWHCEVLWGGRNQEGVGGGAGEDMELAFSYLSRCGSTTKNMGKANREDTLTAHVLFWNARKIEGLARHLCKRYEVAKQAIKSTNRELDNLLTNVGAERQVLDEWLLEIQACAKAANTNSMPDAPDERLQEYFRLKQKMREGSELQKYTGISSKQMSLLVGTEDFYIQAIEVAAYANDTQRRLGELQEILCEKYEETDDTKLYQMGREAAISHIMSVLQDQIELSCQQIKTRLLQVAKYADSSKMRKSLRQKNVDEKSKVKHLIEQYNSIKQMDTTCGIEDALVEDVLSGTFPWQQVRNGEITWKTKKAAIDLWMICKRNEEEVEILKTEMKNYLMYFKQIMQELETEIQQYSTPVSEDETLEEKPWFEVEEETNWRYKALNFSPALQNGMMALKKKGVDYGRKHLKKGTQLFHKVLSGDEIDPIDEDWEMDMDENEHEVQDSDGDID